MKKSILILYLFISGFAFGQNRFREQMQTDSIAVPDSVALFSINDLRPVFDQLKKLPYETAQPFIQYMQDLVAARIRQWQVEKQFKKK